MKNYEEFKLETDKVHILSNGDLLSKYVSTITDYIEATKELNDIEKSQLVKTDFFLKQITKLKLDVIKSIQDDKIKMDILKDENYISENFKYNFELEELVMSLGSKGKMEALNNKDFLEKMKLAKHGKMEIIKSLDDESKNDIIKDEELVKELEISLYDVSEIIQSIKNENLKIDLYHNMDFSAPQKANIIRTLSLPNKIKEIINTDNSLRKIDIISVINSMETQNEIEFINNNLDFMKEKEIRAFDILRAKYDADKQLEFVYNMDKLELTEAEYRKIIAGLRNESKEQIDLNKIDEKYRSLTELKLQDNLSAIYEFGKILPDLSADLTIYKDLDELLYIAPLDDIKSDEQRKALKELCEICPDARITDNLHLGGSTGKQYNEGEKWIDSVLEGLQPNWNDIQKLAYIDCSIGKRLSYTPEQGTEVENSSEQRNLWEIVVKRNGVCNGIAQLEEYMLSRIGIESQRVASDTHSYLKVKNIEIPTENGIKRGDTLIDPTWNLASSRYDARPQHFCRNYEELRKIDIDVDGIDHKCHKCDELENEDLIEMDLPNLRKVYTSIGVAREDGNFPAIDMIEKTEKINELAPNVDSNIQNKFKLLKSKCPEFAECMKSTIKIMQGILFEKNDKFDYKKCIASRVYDKNDEKKKAVLFLYFDFDDKGKRFYYADKQQGEFIELPQDEFEKKFDCYKVDLKDNKRLWEQENEVKEQMENSSGKIVEGDERE